MAKIKPHLECPVCLNIPRELPLPSCPSGHIVCRPCKTRLTDCPTCRQPMPENMTNSIVGALIEQVEHRCKFHDQGCEVKMMLKDLLVHEKWCLDRTLQCPFNTCGDIVKLEDIHEHFFRTPPGSSMSHSHIINRDFTTFDISRNSSLPMKWRMVCVRVDDELFHLRLAISQHQECFVLSVWSSPTGAVNYRANLEIKDNEKALSMTGLCITSVENVPSIDQCMEENGKYFWCIPFTLAENFSIEESNSQTSKQLLHVDFKFEKKI